MTLFFFLQVFGRFASVSTYGSWANYELRIWFCRQIKSKITSSWSSLKPYVWKKVPIIVQWRWVYTVIQHIVYKVTLCKHFSYGSFKCQRHMSLFNCTAKEKKTRIAQYQLCYDSLWRNSRELERGAMSGSDGHFYHQQGLRSENPETWVLQGGGGANTPPCCALALTFFLGGRVVNSGRTNGPSYN